MELQWFSTLHVHICTCVHTHIHTQVHICIHTYTCVYMHTLLPAWAVCRLLLSEALLRKIHQMGWVCDMAEQPPHQNIIIIESIMWCSPGEGMACRPARWAVEECVLLQSREQIWAGSCQAMEPREQMAAAQLPPSPAPWLPGKKPRQQASCGYLSPFTRPSCTLSS